LGVKFVSPKKYGAARTQRVVKRALIHLRKPSERPVVCPQSPMSSDNEPREENENSPIITSIGEHLRTDYQIVAT